MSALGKQTHEHLEVRLDGGKTDQLGYLRFLPVGYRERHDPWPLMLFLHGAGERGTDLELVKVNGPPKIVEHQNDFPFVVISPQCCVGDDWRYAWQPEPLIQLIDHALGECRVDPARVYATGISMGGYGAWRLAAAHPDRFAAIAPICGGGDPRRAARLAPVPIWAFHGAKDDIVPLSESEEMVRAVLAAGGDAKLTVYPNAGHDSWTETYENEDLYDWLLSHMLMGRVAGGA